MKCFKVSWKVDLFLGILCIALPQFGYGQPLDCPSKITVFSGESTIIDCSLHSTSDLYQFTSPNPFWLTYLNDSEGGAPRFYAPPVDTRQEFVYHLQRLDQYSTVLDQTLISITVLPDEHSSCSDLSCGFEDGFSEVDAGEYIIESIELDPSRQEPHLRCIPQVTVESGSMAEIQCTGYNPAGGPLEYTIEFDWPPYIETRVLDAGDFDYVIRTPVIEDRADVRRLEISAQVLELNSNISQDVEVHIIDTSPRFSCENMIVEESASVTLPCIVTTDRNVRYQFISDPPLVQPKMFDQLPSIIVPEVDQDVSFTVTARIFHEAKDGGGHVTEEEFEFTIQDTSEPLDWPGDADLECTIEGSDTEYEGNRNELIVTCTITNPPIDDMSNITWSIGTNSNEPPDDIFNFILDNLAVLTNQEPTKILRFEWPAEIDKDHIYQYIVTATTNRTDLEGSPEATDDTSIKITVLNKPEIIVDCDDETFRIGDDPQEISCMVSNSGDKELDYSWEWESSDHLDRISAINIPNPIFTVPTADEQQEPSKDYEYTVTVESENADPRSTTEPVTITVEYLGVLDLECEDYEVDEGSEPFPLRCTTDSNRDDLTWKWEPAGGSQDLLEDNDPNPPIFTPPASVSGNQDYTYDVWIEADLFIPSEKERVTITVRDVVPPKISIQCDEAPSPVRTGDDPIPLSCSASNDQNEDLTYQWQWNSEVETHLEQLSSTAISSPIYDVPTAEEQQEPSVTYTYQVTAMADNADPPTEPASVTITVERYLGALTLECTNLEVIVGMEPQRIQCEVSNELDEELEYLWEWNPTTLLTETDTGTPLFAVPSEQRAFSRTYSYSVSVQTDLADGAETSVTVTVLNPNAEFVEDTAISTSELDLGLVGSGGEVTLDPATEQVSGLVYGGTPYSGRLMVRAQDSVTVSFEYPESVLLYHENDSENQVSLTPEWAYSESCVQFSAVSQSSSTLQARLQPWECHVIRLGGMIDLEDAKSGSYSGSINVVLTVNDVDEVYEVPVLLSVEDDRQVVVLDPTGVRFESSVEPSDALQWSQSISINPQVAVLGTNKPNGTFTIHNPSVFPMEVQVSTQAGYRENQTVDRFSVATTGKLGDMADLITIHPSVILLLPGETQHVHYSIPESQLRLMGDQGYASLFNFTTTSRSYIEQSRAPLEQQSPQVTFQALGVYIPQRGVEDLLATIESESEEFLIVLIETDSYPFYGDVVVLDGTGSEVGRSQVLVFTRSRVRVDVRAISSDGYTLQFEPYLPDQAIPSSIEILSDD